MANGQQPAEIASPLSVMNGMKKGRHRFRWRPEITFTVVSTLSGGLSGRINEKPGGGACHAKVALATTAACCKSSQGQQAQRSRRGLGDECTTLNHDVIIDVFYANVIA